MEFTTALELVMPSVQELKLRLTAQHGPRTPLAPSLVALRGGRVLCAAQAPQLDAVLELAPTMAVGLGPELVVLAAEMTYPAERTNPVTGQPWQPGDVQVVAREHDGVAQGWVREGIAYTSMTRERRAALHIQDLTVSGTGISFGDPVPARPSDRSLMDRLASAMSLAPLDPSLVSRKGGSAPGTPGPGADTSFVPAAEGRLVLDAGTANAMGRKLAEVEGNVVFVAADNEQATRLLANGMPREMLLGPAV